MWLWDVILRTCREFFIDGNMPKHPRIFKRHRRLHCFKCFDQLTSLTAHVTKTMRLERLNPIALGLLINVMMPSLPRRSAGEKKSVAKAGNVAQKNILMFDRNVFGHIKAHRQIKFAEVGCDRFRKIVFDDFNRKLLIFGREDGVDA